ncbi:MAG: hypothetical protein JSR58_07685 [Verrucomicrobia bacterium]|nr:hypothetical protein [Verrucomicrobiota bacterium]
MSNILTLKRTIIGDSSYVPSLKLYDKTGKAVDAAGLSSQTKAAIQKVASRIFEKISDQAGDKKVQSLSDYGLSVEEGAAVSLEDADVDYEWETILALIVKDMGENMTAPIESRLRRTSPESVVQLAESNVLIQQNKELELDNDKTRVTERFKAKYGSDQLSFKIQAFILKWLEFHSITYKAIVTKNAQGLDSSESAFYEACKKLAKLHLTPDQQNGQSDLEQVKKLYEIVNHVIQRKKDN